MSKPGNTRRRGRQTDHGTATGIGAPGERARYVTHEEQLRELVAHMRRRNRRLARAIVTALSAPPRTLAAFGEIARFVVKQARREGRREGRGAGGSR